MIWKYICIAGLALLLGTSEAETKKSLKAKIVPPTADECLAKNILGEAGLEPTLGKKAVAYVTVMYAKKLGRTICAEVYSGRYDWPKHLKTRRTVERTVGTKAWRLAIKIARELQAKPVPPHPKLRFATSYFRPEHSTPIGIAWFEMNTVRLVKIGHHVFCAEIERTPSLVLLANGDWVPIPRMKPWGDFVPLHKKSAPVLVASRAKVMPTASE